MRCHLVAPVVLVSLLAQVPLAEAVDTCAAANPVASIPLATPTSAFTDNGDGTVTHSLTHLMWKKCPQGLSDANCATGTATTMTWSAALAAAVADTTAGYADWRLPNAKELASIAEHCGYTPAINRTLFPNTPAFYFLSSTTHATSFQVEYVVNFDVGNRTTAFKSGLGYVRLVRGGQSFDAFDAQNAPPPPPLLDVDASISATKYDALTDGVILIRYLVGLTGSAMTAGAVGGTATRADPVAIKAYLEPIASTLDIDGNGSTDSTTDGLLVLRYLFGLRGDSLIAGAIGAGATRTTATEIESYIQLLMP